MTITPLILGIVIVGVVCTFTLLAETVIGVSSNKVSLTRSMVKSRIYSTERKLLQKNMDPSTFIWFSDKSHHSLNHSSWHGVSKMMDRLK